MGGRGGATGPWEGCGWWQPCETWGHELEPLKECQNIQEVWVVGAMWDHGAMSHGWAWGPCDGHGKGAWEGKKVRAGRAERAACIGAL